MAPAIPVRKRALDVALILVSIAFLMPLFIACSLAIFCLEGRPIFYVSRRRVFADTTSRLIKFRTMRRDADRIANRDTVPCATTRFLNISPDSPLYTEVGRAIERLLLTELPQVIHVLHGSMSLVGNRPLPENVIAALREIRPDVADRFRSPAGLTGPVQLVGRDYLTDQERLDIEIAYCQRVEQNYSVWLDMKILFLTVIVGLNMRARLTPAQALAMLCVPVREPLAISGPRGWGVWSRLRHLAKSRRFHASKAH